MTARDVLPKTALLILVLALASFAPASASAEEEPAKDGPADESAEGKTDVELKEASKEEAKQLLDALKKVYKKKNATQVLPALEAMAELKHASWDKAFLRLLKHKSSLVAMRASEMWSGRVTEKNVKKLWKCAWAEKANDKRFKVKTKVLRAMTLFGHRLDKNQFKEVARDWRWMIGNPHESYADALIDICFYFEKLKDKRHARALAEELDDPTANVDPSAATTQPAEWQERRWKMWSPMKPAAVAALQALTGKEFDSTAQAEKWIRANKKSGFEW